MPYLWFSQLDIVIPLHTLKCPATKSDRLSPWFIGFIVVSMGVGTVPDI